MREKRCVCCEDSQSEVPSKQAAHRECKTMRHRVGQTEYIYALYLYIDLCVCICVHAHRLTRLVQQDRQGIFICKQPRTLVCRMEGEHKKRLAGGGGERKRERECKRGRQALQELHLLRSWNCMCQSDFIHLPCYIHECVYVCEGLPVCISECGSCTSCDLECYDYVYV